MSAVVSFLWPKNASALQEFLRSSPSTVYVPQTVFAAVPSDLQAQIAAEADERARAIAQELKRGEWSETAGRLRTDRASIESTLLAHLSARLRENMLLVAGLDATNERDAIDLVVLNDDVTPQAKTAAKWAKARGIPSVVVSHSCITGRLYTVHQEDNADHLAVFASRGGKPYLELGMSPDRVVPTGNPAWDVYAALVPARTQIRTELVKRHAFGERDHIVLFATTWSAYFTAFDDDARYEASLRAVLRSVRELRELGVPLRLVVKERPSNAQQGDLRARIIKEEAGTQEPLVVFEDLERWVVGADAVISLDSNVSIEAMIAGTIPINLWTPAGWFYGPYYGAQDGVLEASYDKLSIALAHALGDENLRSQLRGNANARLSEFAVNVGSAASRVAALFTLAQGKSHGNTGPRYVWQELSDPRSVTEKGIDSIYYRNARTDMIARIRNAPRLMLDVGCGAAATGAEIKKRYPQATVVGIELNPEAAAMADGRIDRIIVDNVETLDFAAAGFAPNSIDLVFFPDVLEHLYDPWKVLVRLKPFLARDAQVIASIPNVRNLWLLTQLIAGNWDYAEEGLLDVTHIRFFTKKTAVQLFEQTGYKVGAIYANGDGRVPAMEAPQGKTVNIDMPQVLLKTMAQEDLIELRTLQFVIDAVPVP